MSPSSSFRAPLAEPWKIESSRRLQPSCESIISVPFREASLRATLSRCSTLAPVFRCFLGTPLAQRFRRPLLSILTLPPMSLEPPPVAAPVAPAAEDRTVAILAYITLIGFIVAIVMHSSKKTALGAYHLRQMLGLFVFSVVAWLGLMVVAFIPVVNMLNVLLSPALFILGLVLWLLGLLAAINGQQKPMPILGENFQKWFEGAFR